jgi:hypothetical protein
MRTALIIGGGLLIFAIPAVVAAILWRKVA